MYPMPGPNGVFKPLSFDYAKLRKKWEPELANDLTFIDYLTRLENICISMFDWVNVPPTIDVRFLEHTLCEYGVAVYFNEPDVGDIALTCTIGPELNIYRIPINRHAYAVNGFQRDLSDRDSVLIFNNYMHTPTIMTLYLFAARLTEIERTIDINVKAQKTPVIIVCDEEQVLTAKNAYAQISSNHPVIIGPRNLDWKNINTLNTAAPFVALDLASLKKQIWNEALSFLGVNTVNTDKKERQIAMEVQANLGTGQAQREVMLAARQDAVNQINAMFHTEIEVRFKEGINVSEWDVPTVGEEEGGDGDWLSTL